MHMKNLLITLRKLSLGLFLIAAASAVLLWSDPGRKSSAGRQRRKVALVNYTSVPVLEDGQRGVLDGLAEAGFVDGRDIDITRYNAEGDRPTAIMIAKDVVGGDYDLILTLSTPVLQAVANANLTTRRTHVFTLTTDPWGAGIGISRDDPSQHPPWMTGHGTLQPVDAVFRMARQANPRLNQVGVVWNPSEANSEASTVMARKVCAELDITLVEVTVDSPSAVAESATALVTRGVEAIWAGGDTTVSSAMSGLLSAARNGSIPVFTNMPSDVKQGALFALGADYYEVGRADGALAARVLRGENPADIPVENYVPEQLALNLPAVEGLGADWSLPAEWRSRAALIVDESGVREQQAPRSARPAASRTYRIAGLYFAPNAITESTLEGLKQRLAERGFVEGRNLEVRAEHAQGDMSLIPAILQKQDQSQADLIVTFTTPCLTAASTIVKNKPVVFTEVYDPIAAGAGTTAAQHLPHVTGVGSFPPLETMIDTMQRLVPDLKAIGVVYNNSEANSRKVVGVARDLVKQRQLRLEEATVANASEVLQAAQVLTQRGVDVLWEVGDNTVYQGLESLVKAAAQARVPVLGPDAASVERGCLVGVGISFRETGLAAGDLAARVLLGEPTAAIPFQELAIVEKGANLEAARNGPFTLPVELLQECRCFHGLGAKLGHPAQVALVQLVESPSLDAATEGIIAGLEQAGLKPDRDIAVRKYNAQGDLSQLPLILDNVKTSGADLIITNTTPAMIAAAHATREIPIVFAVATYPPAVGVFPEGQRQPNLVGVYDDPPIEELIELAERREGKLEIVGTVWNPAEPNSEISVRKLRRVCETRSLKLVERNASSVSELTDATAAVCVAGARIIVISADNVAGSGLPAILAVAQKERVPIYSTEPDMVRRGATAAIGDDFYEWGRQTARLAAKVLAGVPPARLDFEKTATQRTLTIDDLVAPRR